MRAFILRRLMETVVSVFIVSIIAFSLVQLIPGDPVLSLVGTETHEEEIQRLRKEMGFDKPLILQYTYWISKVMQGDFGMSLRYKERVNRLIAQSAPISLFLGAVSFAIGMLIGIPAGIITAVRRGKLRTDLLAGELLRQWIKQFQEDHREQTEENARRSEDPLPQQHGE